MMKPPLPHSKIVLYISPFFHYDDADKGVTPCDKQADDLFRHGRLRSGGACGVRAEAAGHGGGDRELIRMLGENKTVILSSHILAEISAVCDHVLIISHGKLVADDTIENLEKQNEEFKNKFESLPESVKENITSHVIKQTEIRVKYRGYIELEEKEVRNITSSFSRKRSKKLLIGYRARFRANCVIVSRHNNT